MGGVFEFLNAALSQERLGLREDKYDELVRTVDTIIHNAWRMDFNISVDSFEDQIQSVRWLVDFSLQSARAVLTFPEIPFEDCDIALRQGYGKAKHVWERICQAASESAWEPTIILRLGQIAGPTTEPGIWNTTEWLPAIVATSITIGKIPRTLGSAPVDWIPVDTLSTITIILEVVQSRRKTQANSPCSVFHFVNPSATSWASLLSAIHDRYAVQRVEMKDWIAELERMDHTSAEDISKKPALKLLPFYKSLVDGDGALSVPVGVEKTQEASPTTRSMGPISLELMANWLQQWNF